MVKSVLKICSTSTCLSTCLRWY